MVDRFELVKYKRKHCIVCRALTFTTAVFSVSRDAAHGWRC